MTKHPIFKAYLAVVCFVPALLLTAVVAWVGTGHQDPPDLLAIPLEFLMGFAIFQAVGMIVVLIDLHFSELSKQEKSNWGAGLLLAMAIVAPFYWIMKIRTRGQMGLTVPAIATKTATGNPGSACPMCGASIGQSMNSCLACGENLP